MIANETLLDPNLSAKALGVLCRLLSRPNNWQVRVVELISSFKEGRTAVYSALDELMASGYVRRVQNTDSSGRWLTVDYQVYERPQDQPPLSCFPLADSTLAGSPLADNEPLVILNENKTEDSKTKGTNTLSAPPQKVAEVPVPKKMAKDNPIFNAICYACGYDPYSCGPSASWVAKAEKELRAYNATAEEISVRADRYKRAWPGITLTPGSLLKHWAQFDHDPAAPASYKECQESTRHQQNQAAVDAFLAGGDD